jgi:hypothetical protein
MARLPAEDTSSAAALFALLMLFALITGTVNELSPCTSSFAEGAAAFDPMPILSDPVLRVTAPVDCAHGNDPERLTELEAGPTEIVLPEIMSVGITAAT